MNSNPFIGLNIEDAKKLYRKQAFRCHPDHGGTSDMFMELQKQFQEYMKWHSENKNWRDSEQANYHEILQDLLMNLPPEIQQYIDENSEFQKYLRNVMMIASMFRRTGLQKSKVENTLESILKVLNK